MELRVRLGGALLLTVAIPARLAFADDAKKDAITVLPWTQASVVFAEGDKTATVSYSQLFNDNLMFFGTATAPLDTDTRIAAFTSENKLTKGFSGSLQFGYDERASYYGELTWRVQQAIDGTRALLGGQIGQAIPFSEVREYKARHPDQPVEASAALKRYFCKAEGADDAACTSLVVGRHLCKSFETIGCGNGATDEESRASVTAAATAIAAQDACKHPVAPLDDLQRDRCFLAGWWLEIQGFATADRAITQLVIDEATTKLLWRILELVDADKAKTLQENIKTADPRQKQREKNEVLLANLDVFKGAIAKLKRSALLARRDLLMTGLLGTPNQSAQAIGVAFDVSYDVLSVHEADLAAKAVDDKKYNATLAVDYTYYTMTPGFAFSVRGGAGRSHDPKAKKTELCTMFPSTDTTVTGKNCDTSALFRAGPSPDSKTTAFIRGALTYQYGITHSDDEVVPGLELRGTWERTGSLDSVTGRLSLFATPIKGSTAARLGIALDASYAINIGDADSRWNVTPLVFLGASFSQLESSHL
jgi:hypothetical protein